MWPFKSFKKLNEDASSLRFLCKRCGSEFSILKAYGEVQHCCLKCKTIHKIWTGTAIVRESKLPNPREVLRVNRIALKFDSDGRIRVLGEIENLSDRTFHHLVLSFDIKTATGSHEIVALPGLDIAGSQTIPKNTQASPKIVGWPIKPQSKLEFNHWLVEMNGKIADSKKYTLENIDISGQLL